MSTGRESLIESLHREPRLPVVHSLKCWPPFYEDVETGRKTFELREVLGRLDQENQL